MKRLIADNDMAAGDCCREILKGHLLSDATRHALASVSRALDEFDFEKAGMEVGEH